MTKQCERMRRTNIGICFSHQIQIKKQQETEKFRENYWIIVNINENPLILRKKMCFLRFSFEINYWITVNKNGNPLKISRKN